MNGSEIIAADSAPVRKWLDLDPIYTFEHHLAEASENENDREPTLAEMVFKHFAKVMSGEPESAKTKAEIYLMLHQRLMRDFPLNDLFTIQFVIEKNYAEFSLYRIIHSYYNDQASYDSVAEGEGEGDYLADLYIAAVRNALPTDLLTVVVSEEGEGGNTHSYLVRGTDNALSLRNHLFEMAPNPTDLDINILMASNSIPYSEPVGLSSPILLTLSAPLGVRTLGLRSSAVRFREYAEHLLRSSDQVLTIDFANLSVTQGFVDGLIGDLMARNGREVVKRLAFVNYVPDDKGIIQFVIKDRRSGYK